MKTDVIHDDFLWLEVGLLQTDILVCFNAIRRPKVNMKRPLQPILVLMWHVQLDTSGRDFTLGVNFEKWVLHVRLKLDFSGYVNQNGSLTLWGKNKKKYFSLD